MLTDDNQVCQVIKRGFLSNGKNYYIRTVMGSFVCRKQEQMKGDMRKNMYSFSAKDIRPEEVLRNRKEPTTKEFLFAKFIARGDDVVDAFIKAFPTNNTNYATQQSRKLISTTRIQNMIKEEVQQALNGVGVTPEYLIERFKDIADLSERDTDKLRSLESLAKIAGIFDSNSDKEQLTVWTGFTPEQLNSIKGTGNAKVEAHIDRKIEANKAK